MRITVFDIVTVNIHRQYNPIKEKVFWNVLPFYPAELITFISTNRADGRTRIEPERSGCLPEGEPGP
ncbi:hypothetical protein, partial [Muriicola sp.]|uniref:hypothetical protein n=1 Tax=Muriicola sp. TaxID=2020856 RepID=UPI003561F999